MKIELLQEYNIPQTLWWRWIKFRSSSAKRHIVGNSPVIVSLTTHGRRLESVHFTIESIGAGSIRPHQLILWLNPTSTPAALPLPLRRLQDRGLDIRYSDNYGPHTKYYPIIASTNNPQIPLVTADDDIIYPRNWLAHLVNAHTHNPTMIHCHRARAIRLAEGRLAPYSEWEFVDNNNPSVLNFATGVGGVIYPPSMQTSLRLAGTAFLDCCPKADDVWLHAVALRSDHRVKQLRPTPLIPVCLPNTQDTGLFQTNKLPNGNDAQIKATYTKNDLRMLLNTLN